MTDQRKGRGGHRLGNVRLRARSAQALFCLALGMFALFGCQNSPSIPAERADGEILVPTEEAPTYHLLEGYGQRWLEHVRKGVETARTYWGSYGPTHVWIVGREDGAVIAPETRRAFLMEYCRCRTSTSERSLSECLPHAQARFFGVMDRGESEAYLSYVNDTKPPMAELVFINVHKWFFERDPVPDPVLRGIHEYTHVFQKSFGATPTWMMEGGAVFAEAWLPFSHGWRGMERAMERCRDSASRVSDPDITIADMEDIDAAPAHVSKYYRELAYDTGAWAIGFMIHESATRRVSSLRDEFYPSVTNLGWETALSKYVRMKDKAAFYAAFGAFMKRPLRQQLDLLKRLKE